MVGRYTPTNASLDSTSEWKVEIDSAQKVPWIPINMSKVDKIHYPLFEQYCKPFKVTLNKGDMLCLPSLWHHHVQQASTPLSGFTAAIAVNYWYDMGFDIKHACYMLVRNLSKQLHLCDTSSEEDGNDE
ncbi:hypothetical protein SeLEV6574_g06786 [Synchytrium endobioticum]|nr:hypothetical protein SeLEV6574_g06786 [Synchytrium endobioticum]